MPKESSWVYMEDKCGQDGWRCKKCKFFVPWYYQYYESANFIAAYRFCPKCGADMKSYTGMENAAPVITINPRL